MEARRAKLVVNKAGSGSTTFRSTLPAAWIREMGLDENNRDLRLIFDGEKIIIEPATSKIKLEFVYDTMYELVEEYKKELTDEEMKSDEVINNLVNVTIDKLEDAIKARIDGEEKYFKPILQKYKEDK